MNPFLHPVLVPFLYFHCFCLRGTADGADGAAADDTASAAYLDGIGVHRGDHKIIEYLADVVKMQLVSESDGAVQSSAAFPTIRLDFSAGDLRLNRRC